MLILTTIRRLAVLLFVFLAWTPAAYAWSRPVQGPVLQPFAYDEAHPYASGQHRGVDLGAGSAGETVVAPAAGTVSFAGTVPTNGKSVTVETPDGYSITLTHLGSIGVVEGAAVAEQDAIGTVGPSGTPEVDGPYVHLGIRMTADPNGYIDPLSLLPPESSATESDSSVSQPSSSSAAPASKPAPVAPKQRRVATSRGSRPAAQGHVRTHPQERVQEPRSRARTGRSSHRPAVRDRAGEQAGSSRRPVVEPATPRPIGLDTGHELRPPVSRAQPRLETSSPLRRPLLALACNWAAALFALGAALAAHRRHRRSNLASSGGAQVVRLPPPVIDRRHASRAA